MSPEMINFMPPLAVQLLAYEFGMLVHDRLHVIIM